MIAVDTNVLLRYVLRDDAAQAARALTFFEEEIGPENPGWVSHIVLVEMAWVLRQKYKIGSDQIAETIRRVLAAEQLIVERPEVVSAALSMELPDFPDALIHACGQSAGCARTVTFDGRFARHPGVELLT